MSNNRLFRALGAPCLGCGCTIPESVLRNWETRGNNGRAMRLTHEDIQYPPYHYWNIRYAESGMFKGEHVAIEE